MTMPVVHQMAEAQQPACPGVGLPVSRARWSPCKGSVRQTPGRPDAQTPRAREWPSAKRQARKRQARKRQALPAAHRPLLGNQRLVHVDGVRAAPVSDGSGQWRFQNQLPWVNQFIVVLQTQKRELVFANVSYADFPRLAEISPITPNPDQRTREVGSGT